MNSHFVSKKLAHLLGFVGLVPFTVLTFGCWVADVDWLGYFIKGQLAYSIALLSFLGGIHWGTVLTAPHLSINDTKKGLLWSVVPVLLAWSATLVGGFGFAVLMAGFIAAYLADKHLNVLYGMPPWYLPLRFKLTCAVVVLLALTVIAANLRG